MAGIPRSGNILKRSHKGLREKYEVSCDELDHLADYANSYKGVWGARMMGGGFGGCTINLIRKPYINEVVQRLGDAFANRFGQMPLSHICNLSDGTHMVSGR